jgi:hypothetical protein
VWVRVSLGQLKLDSNHVLVVLESNGSACRQRETRVSLLEFLKKWIHPKSWRSPKNGFFGEAFLKCLIELKINEEVETLKEL